jgi:hypothetical protein
MLDLARDAAAIVLLFAAWCGALWWVVRPHLARSRRETDSLVERLATAARSMMAAPRPLADVERSVSLAFDRDDSPYLLYTVVRRDGEDVTVVKDHVCLCGNCQGDEPRRDFDAEFRRAVARVDRSVADTSLIRPRYIPPDPRLK